MGISAEEFLSSNPEKQSLDRRIRPTEQQFEDQRDRWNALAEYLFSDLKERSGYSVNSWLQGSYKFGTQIRPASKGHEFDIDLGIYFEWDGLPEDGDYSAVDLKAFVQSSLVAYAGNGRNDAKTVADPPRERCSRIHFDGDFHIDVPSYHLDSERDARSLATASNTWESSDPKALYLWFRDRFDNEQRAIARRLIRYLKMWTVLALPEGSRPSSILVTVLVSEALDEIDLADIHGDDERLLALVIAVSNRFADGDVEVQNPVNIAENLNRLADDGQQEFVDALGELRDCATRALAADNRATAAEIWSEAFAQFFPIPDEEVLKEAHGRALVPMQFVPEVSVRAVPHANPNRIFTGKNGIGPIPRDCDIQFKLENATRLPLGSEIRWMVRNEGTEAELANDMGHKAGRGATAKELSAYNGKHFMDVSVHSRGQLLGYRRLPVSIQGPPVPRRNPARRPAYVALRGRR